MKNNLVVVFLSVIMRGSLGQDLQYSNRRFLVTNDYRVEYASELSVCSMYSINYYGKVGVQCLMHDMPCRKDSDCQFQINRVVLGVCLAFIVTICACMVCFGCEYYRKRNGGGMRSTNL